MLVPVARMRITSKLQQPHQRQHGSGEARQGVEGRGHVFRHLSRDEQLGDQRSEAEQKRSTQRVHRTASPTRSRPHGPCITRLTRKPSAKTSTYDTMTMKPLSLVPSVRNRSAPFRKSTICPIVMKATTAPTLNVAANARATKASASEQMDNTVATGIKVRTDAAGLEPMEVR